MVEPIKTVYRGSESAREYTVISRHDYHFPVSILDGRKRIILRINRAEGQQPIDFPFDLDRIP
ncbi:MAG: hypothetical protein BWY73_01318 [candidate division TA06 bacterium ADurb.Bin417]|uniref:Uncharacterized protein n=1 Tax=candidate division TA06 bacterium ADurb.Bin417 TaxID=1852828 RepID=A0A1V5MB83_UNCT6|nr:MAG: hypothetical protein BWY73_01318 [candidate division TA06 bacterium ADurb.Bin417]